MSPDQGYASGRAVLERKVVHIPDVLADPDYTWHEGQKVAGNRAVLGVPLLRDGEPAGVITVARKVPQPFTDKQIELIETFAPKPLSPSKIPGCSTSCGSARQIFPNR
jgi:GAF domain-containing protein